MVYYKRRRSRGSTHQTQVSPYPDGGPNTLSTSKVPRETIRTRDRQNFGAGEKNRPVITSPSDAMEPRPVSSSTPHLVISQADDSGGPSSPVEQGGPAATIAATVWLFQEFLEARGRELTFNHVPPAYEDISHGAQSVSGVETEQPGRTINH